MKIYTYTFYTPDGFPFDTKDITVSDLAFPRELDGYGFEEIDKYKADYFDVNNFTYELKED